MVLQNGHYFHNFCRSSACNTPYNKAVRKFCKIPNNEKIILELAIGMYDETYKIPISNRKSVDDCLIVCSKEN